MNFFQGWMNEYSDDYVPETYRIAFTSTVYVRLEGSLLRIATPRNKVPKRALWNEPNYKLSFDLERVYDISNCKVSLLPEGLAHKRWWSKKYPVCIDLLPNSQIGVRYRDKDPVLLEDVSTQTGPAKRDEDPTKKTGDEAKPPKADDDNGVKKVNGSGDVDDGNPDDIDDDIDDMVDDYVKIPTSLVNRSHLYLFARSDREKEIWFRRLLAAASYTSHTRPPDEEEETIEPKFREARIQRENVEAGYLQFMKKLGQMKPMPEKSRPKFRLQRDLQNSDVWVNAFVGRIVYDVLKDPTWHEKIKDKIQRKLSAIKVPVFLEELMVSNFDIGDSVPVIERSHSPVMNEYGIWIDLDVSYTGSFRMTVDTKLNLIKLKTMYNPRTRQAETAAGNELEEPAIFDSSVEDSAESSGDDSRSDSAPLRPAPKMLSMVEKIAASKRFQQVTDMKYVKKAMEGVSNTNISLIVEVKGLVGTLVVNIPPPPSDRVW
ncbi:hypothetical protein AAG570_004611 [Ranatra chinensis]|uniref:SMP-LTD domain-containing protein n=1 Tax=Ranatra chinensis TaxID=642074 RepID=A0ABD0Y2S5_9HEMI